MSAASNKKIAYNYGLILGFISIASVVIQYAMGVYNVSGGTPGNSIVSTIMSVVGLVIGVTLVVLALNKIKALQGDHLTLGQGFKAGFTIYVISSLLTAAWMLIYCYVLEPGYQDELIGNAVEQMDKNQGMSEDQIDQAVSMTRTMTGPVMLAIFSILGGAFFGAIISVIVAAIVKKNNPAFEESLDSEV